MNVPARIAGHVASWRYRDSDRLDSWLADQPWRRSGGVRVIGLASEAQVEPLVEALRRAARAADEYGEVQVLLLRGEDLAGGFETAAAEALNLPGGLGRREAIRRIAKELAMSPRLFVAEPTNTTGLGELATAFVEDLTRAAPEASGAVLALEVGNLPGGADDLDFRVGAPADGLLPLLDADWPVLWRAYVHARLAWEVGGDATRAERAGHLRFTDLGIGQDAELENLLNELAENLRADLPPDIDAQARDYLEEAVRLSRPTNPASQRGRMRFLCRGPFWTPRGERRARPSPWWARSVLRRGECRDARPLLRSCLVCAPIAREVLLGCFDLEAHDRAILRPDSRRLAENRRCVDHLELFQRAEPRSVARHYHPGCPAAPLDLADFASYGEVLSVSPRDPSRFAWRGDLRELRNAVAHGHYVCWATLMVLRDVTQALE